MAKKAAAVTKKTKPATKSKKVGTKTKTKTETKKVGLTALATALNAIPLIKKATGTVSCLAITPPTGKQFPTGMSATAVEGSSTVGNTQFTISRQQTRRDYLFLSITSAGPAVAVTKSKKVRSQVPDPGSITITVTGQGPDIQPTIEVPVVFVDDFA